MRAVSRCQPKEETERNTDLLKYHSSAAFVRETVDSGRVNWIRQFRLHASARSSIRRSNERKSRIFRSFSIDKSRETHAVDLGARHIVV